MIGKLRRIYRMGGWWVGREVLKHGQIAANLEFRGRTDCKILMFIFVFAKMTQLLLLHQQKSRHVQDSF